MTGFFNLPHVICLIWKTFDILDLGKRAFDVLDFGHKCIIGMTGKKLNSKWMEFFIFWS